MSKQEDIEKALQAYGLNEKVVATVTKTAKGAMAKTVKVITVKKVTKRAPTKAEPVQAPPSLVVLTSCQVNDLITSYEQRFLEASGIDSSADLSVYPLPENDKLQVQTDKDRSDEHGEVGTPLWMVDEMLDRIDNHTWKDPNKTTEDLCSGLGTFTIRMLRKKYSCFADKSKFDVTRFLTRTHLFIELQPRSCFLAMYVFGTDIRLLIGDAAQKGHKTLANKNNGEVTPATTGLWVWSDVCKRWYDKSKELPLMFKKHMDKKGLTLQEKADSFAKEFNALRISIEKRQKKGGKHNGKK